MGNTGVIYLKIKLKLEHDIPEEQVEDVVGELDYNVSGALPGFDYELIQGTEIVESGTSYEMNQPG